MTKAKKCPKCDQMRICFVGETCFVCHKAQERAMANEGNWKDSSPYVLGEGRGEIIEYVRINK